MTHCLSPLEPAAQDLKGTAWDPGFSSMPKTLAQPAARFLIEVPSSWHAKFVLIGGLCRLGRIEKHQVYGTPCHFTMQVQGSMIGSHFGFCTAELGPAAMEGSMEWGISWLKGNCQTAMWSCTAPQIGLCLSAWHNEQARVCCCSFLAKLLR